MHKTLPAIRRFPPIARIAPEPASRITVNPSTSFLRGLFTAAEPLAPTTAPSERTLAPHLPGRTQARSYWAPASELPRRRRGGTPEPAGTQRPYSSIQAASTAISDEGSGQVPHAAAAGAGSPPSCLRGWELHFTTLRRERGHDGAWSVFQLIQDKGLLKLFALSNADVLRDGVLSAALNNDERVATMIRVAHSLYAQGGYEWPDIYLKIVHAHLDEARFTEAVRCHMQLAPIFLPGAEVFAALISSFVLDPAPQMQDTLKTLYILGTQRGLYDHVIPTLYSSGHSKLARAWRRTFITYKDFPTTSKSSPFLAFLASYYPFIVLTGEELLAARFAKHYPPCDGDDEVTRPHDVSTGQYSDSIVAKWFASLWTSVEFAISLVHKLGLRVIGPRSLQSLALRESDAQGVAARIAQLEKLDIKIASQTYCKVLIFFAKNGEDDLLMDLVNCDIHPDEFDSEETRRTLLAASVREDDWERTRLLQGIEWAIGAGLSSRRLDALLRSGLIERKAGKVKDVLHRMEVLGLSVAQDSALQLLKCTFDGLSSHPIEWKARPNDAFDTDPDSVLNNAIDFTRRLACQDAAIPLRYWRLILYNLGRLGRLDELEQMCLEVVQLYMPPSGGLIPVHREDWPRAQGSKNRERSLATVAQVELGASADHAVGVRMADESKCRHMRNGNDSSAKLLQRQYTLLSNRDEMQKLASRPFPADSARSSSSSVCDSDRRSTRSGYLAAHASGGGSEEREYIPADLPFTHREHPVQKLFDAHFQRSVVRWGFDQTLAARPSVPALMEMSASGIRAFDVACGVRLLANLRNQGVLIDTQIVRATVISRIALSQVPGRRRDRSRDKNEMEAEHLKNLVETAWGSAIFPNLSELLKELERQKPKLWSRYPKLFARAFDKNRHGTGSC